MLRALWKLAFALWYLPDHITNIYEQIDALEQRMEDVSAAQAEFVGVEQVES